MGRISVCRTVSHLIPVYVGHDTKKLCAYFGYRFLHWSRYTNTFGQDRLYLRVF